MSSQSKSEAGQGRRHGRKGQAKKRATVSIIGKNHKASSVHLFFLGTFLLVGSLLIGNSSTMMVAAQESNNDSTAGAANDAQNLVPGNEEVDSENDRLPFLTDEDVSCMDSTTAFIQQNSGLATAHATFQDSKSLYLDEERGIEKFEYPLESVNAMRAACELNDGMWIFMEIMDISCGMETVPLEVHNFGRCVAKTEDCIELDTISLLQAELSGLGFNCWEDGSNPTDFGEDVAGDDKTDSENNSVPIKMDEDVASCMDSTTTFLQQDPGLASASKTFKDSQTLYTNEETGIQLFQYPLESANSMQETCENNNGMWLFVKFMDFTCTINSLKNMPMQVYNFGRCLSKTEDCMAMDTTNLLQSELYGFGFNCLDDEESSGSRPSVSGVDSDVDVPADDKADSENDRLPFLTDEDVACMASTTAFIQQNPGLASASKTFQDSQSLYLDEETGIEKFKYPLESANAMRAACELNDGMWTYVESMDFTCAISGMETLPLQVHNFGRCIAKTEDCIEMDTISLLQAELSGLGFNCWENGSSPTDSVADTGNSEGSESDGNAEENGEQEYNDQDTDAFLDQNDGDSLEDSMPDLLEGLDLSESDQKCFSDKLAFDMQHTELQDATEELAQSMEVDSSEMPRIIIEFSNESTENLKSICQDGTIGGYFSFIGGQEFLCDMMSVETDLVMVNIADCLPDTPECRNLNPFVVMKELWSNMGMTCTEKMEADDSTSSTTDVTEPADNDSNKESDRDNALYKELRLTQSEASCMASSTDFIENSPVLSNATFVYEKSAETTDKTKLGFSKASASEMEQVCAEQGGLWSVVESEDFSCAIEGSNRCINVYNFGNCIVNNNDCQSMDPMIFVEAFFLEVMKFSCRAGCDQLKDTSWHPPTSAPHQSSQDILPYPQSSNNNNLPAQQSIDVSETKLPSFMMAAVLLSALAAILFIGFYRRRAGRRDKKAYETSEITDLGFRTIT